MKRILLPLSLLLLLALAAGCSAQGEAQLDPTMAQQLDVYKRQAFHRTLSFLWGVPMARRGTLPGRGAGMPLYDI